MDTRRLRAPMWEQLYGVRYIGNRRSAARVVAVVSPVSVWHHTRYGAYVNARGIPCRTRRTDTQCSAIAARVRRPLITNGTNSMNHGCVHHYNVNTQRDLAFARPVLRQLFAGTFRLTGNGIASMSEVAFYHPPSRSEYSRFPIRVKFLREKCPIWF